jgi:molecular chaperone GrpE
LTQDPVEKPDGQNEDPRGEAPAAGVEDALELPPDKGIAEHYERRARLAEDRLTEVLTAYRHARTENEGFRERVSRDVERQFDRRREKLLLRFIDILDNFDRALEAAEQTYAGNPLVEGLILVRTQLLQALQQEGLERVPVLGLPFDPAVSEAVGTCPVSDPEHEHVIVKELLRGYRLNGRVARPSRVLVGAFASEAATEGEGETEPLIGADEPPLVGDLDPAAETIPLDENMLRVLFGAADKPKKS